jgi:hypothetical protein
MPPLVRVSSRRPRKGTAARSASRVRMHRALRLPPPSVHITFLIALAISAHVSAAAASSPGPHISSDLRAKVERDAADWIPWFDFGVEALSQNRAQLAARAFLNSARLSGNPAAWSNAGFALTKMTGGPYPRMLHYFAAAYRGTPDAGTAVFLAQAMIMLGMHRRALRFTTLFLTRSCGRSASNCVWRLGKPKILLHSGAAVDADSDMSARAASHLQQPQPTRPQVHHFDLQQTGRRQRACVLVRYAAANLRSLANATARCHAVPQVFSLTPNFKTELVTFARSFISDQMRLHGNSSVPDQDSLRLLLPPTLRLQINRIHALSQMQPDARVFFLPSRALSLPAPLLQVAYFSLQFSPRNSLNGLPSGIFRCAAFVIPLFFCSPSHSVPPLVMQSAQPQACGAALRRHRRLQRRSLAVLCSCSELLTLTHADDTDEERARWLQECDRTHQLWGKDDAAAAAYINQLQLHVLVDLIGRIPHNHHAVLGYRPAPVQIVAIYAATTASPFIDYFITDRIASPPELSHFFTESFIMMPISHFVNNQVALAPVPTNTRHAPAGAGGGGTAAAFNSFYKMDPERARSWWRVLNAVPNSSIMVVKYLYWQSAQSTILSHAEQHNISRSRVKFADKLPSFQLHLQVTPRVLRHRKLNSVLFYCHRPR